MVDASRHHRPQDQPVESLAGPAAPFIGLTGAIAAGKSEALAAFGRLGAATLSSDEVAHELLDSPEMRAHLGERWGERVVADGRVARDRIGAIVFEQPEELRWLESVLHPLVGRRIADWRQGLDEGTPLAVVEVPLLFETGLDEAFDATVSVVASEPARAARAAERGTELVAGRASRQLSQDNKAARATHVIRNDGSLDDLEREVAHVMELLDGHPPGGMSPARTATRGARGGGGRVTRATLWRRRVLWIGVAALVGAGVAIAVSRIDIEQAIQEITLPLRHDDIIRQQAADKDLDPALISAVIYAESRFRDQESHAGARGLMQITPQTAEVIARLSGGTEFVTGDLSDPEINISYGSYYLRHLLTRYDGNEVAALAAYNAGMGNVDRWGGADLQLDGDPVP